MFLAAPNSPPTCSKHAPNMPYRVGDKDTDHLSSAQERSERKRGSVSAQHLLSTAI